MAKRKKTDGIWIKVDGKRVWFGKQVSGQYRKSYRGNEKYLGTDPDKVLERWLAHVAEVDARRAREQPTTQEVSVNDLTVGHLCKLFIAHKKERVSIGRLSQKSVSNYERVAVLLLRYLGKNRKLSSLKSKDFAKLLVEFSKPRPRQVKDRTIEAKASISPFTVANRVQHTYSFFIYAVEEKFIDELPWKKRDFSKPERRQKEIHKDARPSKEATREEILALLENASDTWRAIILMGINSGYGNTDLANLTWSDIGSGGWVEKVRSKTGIRGKFKLWPETIDALGKLKRSPDDNLIFRGPKGADYIPKGNNKRLTKQFSKLADKSGVKRLGLSVYSLRHSFQAIGDESGDYIAVKHIMRHSKNEISDVYRGKAPSNERLEHVTETVRRWLFGTDENKQVKVE